MATVTVAHHTTVTDTGAGTTVTDIRAAASVAAMAVHPVKPIVIKSKTLYCKHCIPSAFPL